MIEPAWGTVCRPKYGQTVSGDTFLVLPVTESELLVSVIDGLGGGREAAQAAVGAAESIQANPSRPLREMILHAHSAIHGTRGAVIGVLRFDLARYSVSFVGVGNIGAYAYSRQPIKPISKNGILGYRMPSLLELSYNFDPGDVFVLYSDGISSRFTLDRALSGSLDPQVMAEMILQRYGKSTDDATVVVIKV